MKTIPFFGTKIAISGLIPFSSVDWPHRLAAVAFCQGCAWHCPYCQNAELRDFSPGKLLWNKIIDWFGTRQGLLEAIVFSGGEPLLQPGLSQAIAETRSLGFDIGLHTSGQNPMALETILPILDWTGLDLKAPRASYERITGHPKSADAAWHSLNLLRINKKKFELRTTWHPAILSEDELLELAHELSPLENGLWVLQVFQPKGCTDSSLNSIGRITVSKTLLTKLRCILPGFEVSLRE